MTILTLKTTYCGVCAKIASIYSTIKTAASANYDRKADAELRRMTDRELADIGICRGDIRRIATLSIFDRQNQS